MTRYIVREGTTKGEGRYWRKYAYFDDEPWTTRADQCARFAVWDAANIIARGEGGRVVRLVSLREKLARAERADGTLRMYRIKAGHLTRVLGADLSLAELSAKMRVRGRIPRET